MTDENYQPEHRADVPEADPVVGEAPPAAHVMFSNAAFDKLKWVAVIVLPAITTAYYGLGDLLELPYTSKVVGVIIILDTLLGALLGISTRQ